MAAVKNRTGQRFGRLTAVRYIGGKRWLCACDCGRSTEVRTQALHSGNTKSCGCLQRDAAAEISARHGAAGQRLHRIWKTMRTRCNNRHAVNYANYGGRGITVCEAWHSYSPFSVWAKNNGYADGLQIDRIDNDLGYCPENCRWVTQRENMQNRRNTVRIEAFGRTWTLPEAIEKFGIKRKTLYSRLYRYEMPPETALTMPLRKQPKASKPTAT